MVMFGNAARLVRTLNAFFLHPCSEMEDVKYALYF